jgi:hypothetical protein
MTADFQKETPTRTGPKECKRHQRRKERSGKKWNMGKPFLG